MRSLEMTGRRLRHWALISSRVGTAFRKEDRAGGDVGSGPQKAW